MSKDELKDTSTIALKWLYKALHSLKEIIAVVVCFYGLYSWMDKKFTEEITFRNEMRVAINHVKVDAEEHDSIYKRIDIIVDTCNQLRSDVNLSYSEIAKIKIGLLTYGVNIK